MRASKDEFEALQMPGDVRLSPHRAEQQGSCFRSAAWEPT